MHVLISYGVCVDCFKKLQMAKDPIMIRVFKVRSPSEVQTRL